MIFSIDAVGELGEAVRYPSKWDYVQKAVWEMISRGGPRAKFTWAPSIHVYNFFKLHELVAYFKKIEKQWLDKDINTNWNVIFQPYYQNVNNIPKDLFEEAQEKAFEELDAANLRDWLDCFVVESSAVGPQLPPTRLEQFNRRARHITAQSMIVLAILGWILPILPGTPFFLLAWALGWRPPGSKHSVPAD